MSVLEEDDTRRTEPVRRPKVPESVVNDREGRWRMMERGGSGESGIGIGYSAWGSSWGTQEF
jgi:hypothetical protein